MLPIVDAALKLASVVVEHLNLREEMKYVNRVAGLRLDIIEERKRGDAADQAKIAQLYKELEISIEAMADQIQLRISGAK